MYESYFGMKLNPFKKDIDIKNTYEFNDFKEVQNRLKYLLNNKGIGLITGTSGKGKTYGVKYFVKNLNPNLYKIVYLSLSTVTVLEFYRSFCIGLGIEPPYKKIDMFNQIQERLKTLVKDRRITPIIICDEVLILVGQPMLNDVLSRNVHEALHQRIIVNYMYMGIEFEEVKKYIIDRCNLAEISSEIFDENAIKALASNCNGSTRYLNNLIDKSLMICCNQKNQTVTNEIVMLAANDLSLV